MRRSRLVSARGFVTHEHLDLSILESYRHLTEEGESDFLLNLIDLFIEDAVPSLSALARAAARNDFDEVQRLAEKLKGSSASLAAPRMYRLCGGLEGLAAWHEPFLVRQSLRELTAEFGVVQAILRENYSATESDHAPT